MTDPERPGPLRRGLPLGALFVLFAGVYVWMHVRSGFTFPTPWTDEVAYLWTGVALGRSGSAIAPELIPDVQMMWVPPGFTLVNGLVFAVFGFSLELARALSASEILGLFAALTFVCARLRAPLVSTIVCGVFLLSTELVLAGNIGRMEALVLCIAGSGMALQSRDRLVLGWCCSALAPLVHPNGLFFTAAATLYVCLRPGALASVRVLSRGERLALAAVALAWLAYGAHVAQNWSDFQIQMGAQFARKLERETIADFVGRRDLFFAALAMPALVLARRRGGPALLLVCYAVFSWLPFSIGLEIWYMVYRQLASCLLGLALVELALGALGELTLRWTPRVRKTAAVALGAVLLAWHWGFGSLPFPPASLAVLEIMQMRPRLDWQRVDEDDLDEIAARLRVWGDCPERVVVRIHPRAESLLLYPRLAGSSILFANPPRIFESVGERHPRYAALPWDVYLVHLTPEPVKYVMYERNRAFKRAGIHPGSREHLVRSRGPVSQWYMRVDEERIAAKCGGAAGS